jgi:3'-5' exoribonuclease
VTKDNLESYRFLRNAALGLDYPLRPFCLSVINNDDFQASPASAKHHHVFTGGLMAHTGEVLEYALAACEPFGARVNRDVLITACIFHDFAKIYDYELSPRTCGIQPIWVETPYRHLIRHVSGSHAMFVALATGPGSLDIGLQRQIEHCILAHHGCLEWGSPVGPQTLEAMLLHHADMLSAKYGASR